MKWVQSVKDKCVDSDEGTWDDQKCTIQISGDGKSLQVLDPNEDYNTITTVGIMDLSNAVQEKEIIQ